VGRKGTARQSQKPVRASELLPEGWFRGEHVLAAPEVPSPDIVERRPGRFFSVAVNLGMLL
jgi:hypothetical protein